MLRFNFRFSRLPLLLLLLAGACFTTQLSAQAPSGFRFQAVARDAANDVMATDNIAVRVSLLRGGPSGAVGYSERHEVTTTDLGVFDLHIGNGFPLSGDINALDWGGDNFFLKIDVDPDGGDSYVNLGASQLLSVPYALYARESGSGGGGGDPADELQNLIYDPATQTLTLTDGNSVTLQVGGAGMPQTLTFDPASNELTISDGNTIMIPAGEQGPAGPQGPAGQDGTDGAPGPVGPAGQDGAEGPAGPQGPQGPAGQDGTGISIQGTVATTGDLPTTNNDPGDLYIVSADGNGYVWDGAMFVNVGQIQGPQGPQGAPGQDGTDGTQGPAGPAGQNGSDGAQGPAGPQGPQGPAGQDGTGISIQGTVATTGDLPTLNNDPGDLYIVSADGNGYVWDGAMFVNVGQIQGPQGPQGAPGQDGTDGTQGPAGQDGADGAQGAPGPQGDQGPAGPAGPTGQDGAQGPAGQDGAVGMQGPTGPAGPAGQNGAQGPVGPAGTYTAGPGININGDQIFATDPSATNEIQTLTLNGNNLELSNGGGSVDVSALGGASVWAENAQGAHYTGAVGIGEDTPAAPLHVSSPDSSVVLIDGSENAGFLSALKLTSSGLDSRWGYQLRSFGGELNAKFGLYRDFSAFGNSGLAPVMTHGDDGGLLGNTETRFYDHLAASGSLQLGDNGADLGFGSAISRRAGVLSGGTINAASTHRTRLLTQDTVLLETAAFDYTPGFPFDFIGAYQPVQETRWHQPSGDLFTRFFGRTRIENLETGRSLRLNGTGPGVGGGTVLGHRIGNIGDVDYDVNFGTSLSTGQLGNTATYTMDFADFDNVQNLGATLQAYAATYTSGAFGGITHTFSGELVTGGIRYGDALVSPFNQEAISVVMPAGTDAAGLHIDGGPTNQALLQVHHDSETGIAMEVQGRVGINNTSPNRDLVIGDPFPGGQGTATAMTLGNANNGGFLQVGNNDGNFGILAGGFGNPVISTRNGDGFPNNKTDLRMDVLGLTIGSASSASSKLHVRQTGAGLGNGLTLDQGTTSTTRWEIQSGTSRDLDIYGPGSSGTIRVSYISDVSGNYNATSDARRKANIAPTTALAPALAALQLKHYNYRGDEKKYLGFLAQEIGAVFPTLTTLKDAGKETEVMMVDYSQMSALALGAAAEQQREIDTLKAQNAALEAKNTELEARLARIERLLSKD